MATTLAMLQGSARTPLGPQFATSVFPCANLSTNNAHNAKTTKKGQGIETGGLLWTNPWVV